VATETTTIRVTRETRDTLARQARQRGISLSSLVSQLAGREERNAVFRAEREAAAADRRNHEAIADEDLWSSVAADGID
jgi:hypothetical protein